MPIGGGQTLGLKAKVEAAVDRQSQRKLTKQVEEAIGKAEDVAPGMDGGFRGRTMPGPDGSRGGGGFGAAAAGGAAARSGLASKAGSLLGGGGLAGGAALLGTVALGGALANRMLGAMMAASGEMKATASILGTASDLFWKPFGDFLGKTFRPMAEALLDFAVGMNKNISENGLIVGGVQTIVDGIRGLPAGIANVITQAWGQRLEALFGELEIFTGLQNFDWSDYLVQLNWADWASELVWDFYVDGDLDWGDWVDPVDWDGLIPTFNWEDFINVPDWLKPDSTEQTTNTETNTNTNRNPGGGDDSLFENPYVPGSETGPPSPGGREGGDVRLGTIVMNNRRVGEVSRQERNTYLHRIV